MKDDIFNADQKEVKQQENYQKLFEQGKQRRINFGMVFSTREGFEVLKDIKTFCHADEISHVPSNQFETAFREGERNIYLYILSNLSDEMKSKISIGG